MLQELSTYHPIENPYNDIDLQWKASKRQLLFRVTKAHDSLCSVNVADELIIFHARSNKPHDYFMVDSFDMKYKSKLKDSSNSPVKRGIYILKNNANEVYFYLTKSEKSLMALKRTFEKARVRILDNAAKEGSSKFKKITETFKRLGISSGELFPTGEITTSHSHCELCSTKIKNGYETTTRDKKVKLIVGSECIIQQTAMGGNNVDIMRCLSDLRCANKKEVIKAMPYLSEARLTLAAHRLSRIENKTRDSARLRALNNFKIRDNINYKQYINSPLYLLEQRQVLEEKRNWDIQEHEKRQKVKFLIKEIQDNQKISSNFNVIAKYPYKNNKGYVVKLEDENYLPYILFVNEDNRYLDHREFKTGSCLNGVFTVKGLQTSTYNGKIKVDAIKGFFKKTR